MTFEMFHTTAEAAKAAEARYQRAHVSPWVRKAQEATLPPKDLTGHIRVKGAVR